MNSIQLTWQNSETVPIRLWSNGEQLKLGEDDYLVFTVREKVAKLNDDEYLIRKVIEATDYNEELEFYPVNILPEDTEEIELNNYDNKKRYLYDVTLYNHSSANIERTLIKGDCIIGWRASKEDDT